MPKPKTVVLLCLLFTFFFFSFKFYSSWQNRLWISGSRISIIVAGQNPTIYSYNPTNDSITEIVIPKNTQLVASGNWGTWLAGSLWDLGVQEKKGGLLLARSVQKSLGVPIDGWTSPGGEELFADHVLGLPQALFQVIKTRNIKTNLGFFDRVNLILASGRVGKLSRTVIDLAEKRTVLKKTTLPDGVLGFVPIAANSSEMGVLRDDTIFASTKTLSISNGSEKGGLAKEVSRVASVLGLRVISVDTADKKTLGICTLRATKDNLSSLAARRLVQLYGCKSEVGEPSRPSNIEIILGRAFAGEF